MSNENCGPEATKDPLEISTDAMAASPSTESPQPAGGDARPYHPDDVIAGLRAEVADLKDKVLRAHAEMDNVRKRVEREKVENAKYAITKFARDMVTVADNFQRAVDAAPPEARQADGPLKSLLDGITMIEREFLNALGRHGVRREEPTGQPFDPNQQQAVMEVQDASVAAGTVVQVFQPGYSIEDRVLRPAMVVVAKGGPKAGAKARTDGAPEPSSDPGGTGPGGDRSDASGEETSAGTA